MVCSACGTENPAGSRFCGGCGAALSQACGACGAANDPGMRFCTQCGSALGADTPDGAAASAAAPRRAEAAAERRHVSVLFADLVGFTNLSESRDAEEVRELLSRYFDTCKRLISLYGGTVEKFIGDAVMAVWGTPTATEDDAERAVRAALDVITSVTALGEELGAPELRARAGVLTGEAAVTIGAEGQGMVAGDLVNTASRIQSVAEPGTVLVGGSTRQATEAAIAYLDAGSHQLKGKAEPVPLWRAQRVVSGRQGALKSQGLEAPFVGRDRELRQIKDLYHASADEKKAHLVSVTGIAGIGKSRLAWEFYKYFDGLVENVYWHRGRCLSYGEGVTYWALADMIRMRCRIGEEEEPASAAAKLHATLEEHILDADERSFVEPRLAQLLGLAEQRAGDRQDLFAAWRLFFERLAETYPTVLAFEDLQWADASLLDFIEYLLEWSRNHPLYVLTLARPELAERRPGWGAGHRNFSSLYLEPLPESAMEELLAGLVPGLPTGLRDQILARAEGVPLYAVETVRMLLDRGALVQEGSVYRPVEEIASLEVPETLHALIAARLDGLPPEERRLLQDGAVLGKTFTRAAIAAVSGLAEAELESLLRSLVRKEILSVQADPRSPEHGQYGFLQDLVRRVAYDTLSRRERRARHLAAAAHLEQSAPDEDEIVEVIASHYLDAHQAVPDAEDAAEIQTRARETLVRAGERAETLGATSEAQRYLERAARLADDGPSLAALLQRAGWLAYYAGDYDAAGRLLAESVELYEAAGETHASARVSTRLAYVERYQGRFDDARARAERAFEVIAGDEPDEDLAFLASMLGGTYVFAGDYERANERIELALEIAQSLGFPEVLTRALAYKSIIAIGRGRPEEALAFLKHGLAVALEHDLFDSALNLYFNLSDVTFQRDRYDDALGYLREALELTRRRGNRPFEWAVVAETTYPLFMTGRWEEALAAAAELPEERLQSALTLSLLTSGLEIRLHRGDLGEARRLHSLYAELEHTPEIQDRGCYLAAAATLRGAEGNQDDALALGVEATELVRPAFGIGSQIVKQGLVAALEAALRLGDRGRAGELLEIIDSVPPGLRSPYLEAQAQRFRARLAGLYEEAAEAGYAAAAERFGALGIPFWRAVTLLEHGEWLVGLGRREEAEPLLTDARETFEKLGARPWLERLTPLVRRGVGQTIA
jgi:predicted ATPase/class 3 adenylate cyclase